MGRKGNRAYMMGNFKFKRLSDYYPAQYENTWIEIMFLYVILVFMLRLDNLLAKDLPNKCNAAAVIQNPIQNQHPHLYFSPHLAAYRHHGRELIIHLQCISTIVLYHACSFGLLPD